MRGVVKILLCMLVFAALLHGANAFTIKPKTVPTTDLRSNDPIQLQFDVSFASFSSTHDIKISSELNNQDCVVQIYSTEFQRYVDLQVDRDRAGDWVVYGWVLPSESSFTIQITLKGTVPQITATRNITLFYLTETAGGATVSGGEYRLERRVVNPQEIAAQVTGLKAELSGLKSNISAAAAGGANTTEAQAKYSEAETAVNRADSLKSSNFNEALSQLDKARSAISAAYSLIEKAKAQYEIEKVRRTMEEVSGMLTYFRENRSVGMTDSRYVAIVNKYDLASQSLSSANDMVTSGAYIQAQTKAREAGSFANESLNLSQAFREELGEGGLPISINPVFVVIVLVLIVAGIAGYLVYKKHFRWDELG